jgi:allantoicase
MTDFTELVDLASVRLGGAVVAANDEFFAPKERLLGETEPVDRPELYTERGKWMDGWETRRRREPGSDWCLVRLGVAGTVRGVVVDTRHFRGNFPPEASLDGLRAAGTPSAEVLLAAGGWRELLPRSPLAGDAVNRFAVEAAGDAVTHLRLHIYPDGGVARLRVYGEVEPDWEALERRGGEVDLAALEHGGRVIAASDMFFGARHNLILPGSPRGMFDGWETRRRRGPGHDWAVVRLGAPGEVRRVEVDTRFFRGNAPGACEISGLAAADGPGADAEAAAAGASPEAWRPLLPRTPLLADSRHQFAGELADPGPLSHVRLAIHPDGGVARLRVWGRPAGWVGG